MNDFEALGAAFSQAVDNGGTTLADAALVVGASAASLGYSLSEALDRVAAAFGDREPDFGTVRLVAEAWAESVASCVDGASCHDPLTSLSTVPHLRSRLDDLYRLAASADTEVRITHALVVVEVPRRPRPHPLAGSLRALEIAEALYTAFPTHECVTELGDHRFAALVRDEEADAVGLALASRLLADAGAPIDKTRIWVERLPRDTRGLAWMLSGLVR